MPIPIPNGADTEYMNEKIASVHQANPTAAKRAPSANPSKNWWKVNAGINVLNSELAATPTVIPMMILCAVKPGMVWCGVVWVFHARTWTWT